MSIIIVTCHDRGAGVDPEALGLRDSPVQDPTFINAYCQAATNLAD